jgi:hypothetical protein
MRRRSNKEIPDEWLLLALNQADRIHSRKEVAHKIVCKASSLLSVNSRKQSKRLFAKTKHPKRIYLTELHLFQYLVFSISERYEEQQEVDTPDLITELDLIVRYIAFIVRQSFRNSFYCVTGVCRFICRYEFHDVRGIYEKLIDSERWKNDDDYRKNRKKMRDMIFKRFSRYLRLEETRNGMEKHFQLREDQNDLSLWQLIANSLDSFKPWQTECIPPGFNLRGKEQTTIRHRTEHVSEIKRIHTLLHQDCLKTLTDAVPCANPNFSLGVPQFFAATSLPKIPLQGPPDSYPMPSDSNDHGDTQVTQQRLEAVRRALTEHSEKLARFLPEGLLTVKLDGKDVASLNLDATNRVQFTVNDDGAELIEIVSEKDQLFLGAHLLDEETWQSPNREHAYFVRHPTGPKIIFTLRRIENGDARNHQLSVVVTYKKGALAPFVVFLEQAMAGRLSTLKLAPAYCIEYLSSSRLRAPVLAAGRSSRLVLISLAMFTLTTLVLFLLLGPLSFRRNVTTTREANSIVPQGRPPATELTETRSTPSSNELPKHLGHRKHSVAKTWATPTTLEYQRIAKPLLPVGEIPEREFCNRCIVHWTLENRIASAEKLIDNSSWHLEP